MRRDQALERGTLDLAREPLVDLWIGLEQRCVHHAGADGIDANAVRGQQRSHEPGDIDERRLRGTVGHRVAVEPWASMDVMLTIDPLPCSTICRAHRCARKYGPVSPTAR